MNAIIELSQKEACFVSGGCIREFSWSNFRMRVAYAVLGILVFTIYSAGLFLAGFYLGKVY